MIETPAAVLLSDRLAAEADFFSIGTNDLIQYIMAADRMNEKVQNLYRTCNLSVLRAIKTAVQNAHEAGIKVSMCGEAASDEKMVPVWIGMGIDKLSMVRSQTARIKYIIRHLSKEKAKDVTARVFELDRIEDIEEYLEEVLGTV
jgi:phosphotransferase system enzyme I (PtsI)